jgi:hypothetical protein
VRVVDGDEERRFERGALEQLLQVAQQPEAWLGLRVESRKAVGIEQGVGPVEQRCQQSGKLDHGLARIGGAGADADPLAAGDRGNLCEQAALAHAGGALDHDHCFGAVREVFKSVSN